MCILVLVSVCGFGAGMIAVYLLRKRKEKRQSRQTQTKHTHFPNISHPPEQIQDSVGKCMVHNPIYGGSGEIYEELPDEPPNTPCLNGASATPLQIPASLPPSVPPPRKTQEMSESKREAIEAKLEETQDRVSLASSCRGGEEAEDCYTVMSPAGTMTVLPRNRHSTGSLTANWPLAGNL